MVYLQIGLVTGQLIRIESKHTMETYGQLAHTTSFCNHQVVFCPKKTISDVTGHPGETILVQGTSLAPLESTTKWFGNTFKTRIEKAFSRATRLALVNRPLWGRHASGWFTDQSHRLCRWILYYVPKEMEIDMNDSSFAPIKMYRYQGILREMGSIFLMNIFSKSEMDPAPIKALRILLVY
jgi:hypothetical protein